jgi:hypothetical protein
MKMKTVPKDAVLLTGGEFEEKLLSDKAALTARGEGDVTWFLIDGRWVMFAPETPAERAAQITPEGIKKALGDDDALVSIKDEAPFWAVQPVKYLGPTSFSRIAVKLMPLGAEYVSEGILSRWRIPKGKPPERAAPEK